MSPVPLADLAQQLGHADSRMTTRHYAHLPARSRAGRAWRHVRSVRAASVQKHADGRLMAFSERA